MQLFTIMNDQARPPFTRSGVKFQPPPGLLKQPIAVAPPAPPAAPPVAPHTTAAEHWRRNAPPATAPAAPPTAPAAPPVASATPAFLRVPTAGRVAGVALCGAAGATAGVAASAATGDAADDAAGGAARRRRAAGAAGGVPENSLRAQARFDIALVPTRRSLRKCAP
ncbi:hypothetical protein FPV67DRAFT_1460826 [Lyophyllum atratum]|nr:hypothetical protein FPV67DRAFT_1460826 [Lyophyllum atratum]